MLDWFQNYRFIIDNGLIVTLLTMSIFVAFNAGVMSLGSVGFMAVGGYTTAILTVDHGWPVPLAIAAGAVLGGVLAYLFGLLVLRLSGIYLALGTFALAQALIIFINAVDFTKVVTRRGNPTMMFMTGRIKAKGDLGLATKITGFFEVPKA